MAPPSPEWGSSPAALAAAGCCEAAPLWPPQGPGASLQGGGGGKLLADHFNKIQSWASFAILVTMFRLYNVTSSVKLWNIGIDVKLKLSSDGRFVRAWRYRRWQVRWRGGGEVGGHSWGRLAEYWFRSGKLTFPGVYQTNYGVKIHTRNWFCRRGWQDDVGSVQYYSLQSLMLAVKSFQYLFTPHPILLTLFWVEESDLDITQKQYNKHCVYSVSSSCLCCCPLNVQCVKLYWRLLA